ncbi:hypothetical protein T439DRAFT_355207 [Meredithblackwellia eburnea MCA 4105]
MSRPSSRAGHHDALAAEIKHREEIVDQFVNEHYPKLQKLMGPFERMGRTLQQRYKEAQEGRAEQGSIFKNTLKVNQNPQSHVPSELGMTDDLVAALGELKRELVRERHGELLTYELAGTNAETATGADFALEINFFPEEHVKRTLADKICSKNGRVDFNYRTSPQTERQVELLWKTAIQMAQEAVIVAPAFLIYSEHQTVLAPAWEILEAQGHSNNEALAAFERRLAHQFETNKKYSFAHSLAHIIYARTRRLDEYAEPSLNIPEMHHVVTERGHTGGMKPRKKSPDSSEDEEKKFEMGHRLQGRQARMYKNALSPFLVQARAGYF